MSDETENAHVVVGKFNGFCMECREVKPIVKIVKWATVPFGICEECQEGD